MQQFCTFCWSSLPTVKGHRLKRLDTLKIQQLGSRPLHVQVLFSSVTALLGSPGQSSYAAANGSLNALASLWRRQGTPSTAVQWGPWADLGMAAGSAGLATRARQWGLGMLAPEESLAALGGALALQASAALPGTIAAAHIEWPRFLQHRFNHGHDNISGMFAEFETGMRPDLTAGLATDSTGVAHSGAAHTAEAPAITLQRMQGLVRAAVSNVLGSEVSGSHPLMAAGMWAIRKVMINVAAFDIMLTDCYCRHCAAPIEHLHLPCPGMTSVCPPPYPNTSSSSTATHCRRPRLAELGGAAHRPGSGGRQ